MGLTCHYYAYYILKWVFSLLDKTLFVHYMVLLHMFTKVERIFLTCCEGNYTSIILQKISCYCSTRHNLYCVYWEMWSNELGKVPIKMPSLLRPGQPCKDSMGASSFFFPMNQFVNEAELHRVIPCFWPQRAHSISFI